MTEDKSNLFGYRDFRNYFFEGTMHEAFLVKNIIDILDREVKSEDIGKIKKVHLEVGQMRYVVPDIINACFRNAPKHKKLAEADIEIQILPVKVKCRDCGFTGVIEEVDFTCNKCKSRNVELLSGNELSIKGIEW